MSELLVEDIDASLAFWRDVLGFEVACRRPAEGFVYLERPDGVQLMLSGQAFQRRAERDRCARAAVRARGQAPRSGRLPCRGGRGHRRASAPGGTRRYLFVCSENRLRSPTAEAVFSAMDGIDAIGAGTNADAETPVSGDLIEWADVIFVMEASHRKKVASRFRELLKDKRLVVLGIPDNYACMQPELVALLKARVSDHGR